MKRLILIALLFALPLQAQNKFVSANTGSDANSGADWANAYLTLGKLNSNLSAGDTAVCVGTFTESLSPNYSGASGDTIVIMDSLSYTNGFNLTNPDTANLWSAKINGQSARVVGIYLNADSYLKIIGFDIYDHDNNQVDIVGGSAHNTLLQCRVRDHGDGTGDQIEINSTGAGNKIISSLILGDGGFAADRGIYVTAAATSGTKILNNTVYGNFDNTAFHVDDNAPLELKNNVFYNTSSVAGDYAGIVASAGTGAVSDWDNNLWYAPNVTNTWSFNSSNFDVVATWIDSVNNYDADGEANALNAIPGLLFTATTCAIDENSAVYDKAENNAWNDASNPSIGYFQFVSECAQIIVVQ